VSRRQLPLAIASSNPEAHTFLGLRSRCRARSTPGNSLLPAAPAPRRTRGFMPLPACAGFLPGARRLHVRGEHSPASVALTF